MIEIIEGRGVGAGKSYYACLRIISHLAAGGTVYASDTFGLKWADTVELIRARYGVLVEQDQYATFEEGDIKRLHEVTPPGTPEMPVLIVVDECQGELNARDWNDSSKRAFFKWLTQSRHDDNDVIFISQSAHNIDKQVARLVTYVSRVRNMRNFSFPGLGRWPLAQFVVNRFDQDGRTLLERKWHWHDKGVFACYVSKVMRGSHRRLNHTAVPRKQLKKPTVQTNKMAKFLLIAIVVLIGVGIWKLNQTPLLGGKKEVVAATPAHKTVDTPAPQLRTGRREAKLREGELSAYDIIVEAFRSQTGPWDMTTDAGEYSVGRMSARGLVVGLQDRVARVVQPDGRIAFVVADGRTIQREAAKIESPKTSDAIPQPGTTPEPTVSDAGKGKIMVGGTVRNGKLIPYYAPDYENSAQRGLAGAKPEH